MGRGCTTWPYLSDHGSGREILPPMNETTETVTHGDWQFMELSHLETIL